MKNKILVIAGARPNFMKVAPLLRALRKNGKCTVKLVHTGQHYDFKMSDVFFQDLGMSPPDIHLGVGSGSHSEQTARIMIEFEKVVLAERPQWVVVVGDVNSTLACSIVAAKLKTKVAHVEAGLRSFDRDMPEEINRLVTDSISDRLFVSEPSGLKNLRKEGVDPKKVVFVGNVMIDTLLYQMPKIRKSGILETLKVKPGTYAVLTMHRPSNVDSKVAMEEVVNILQGLTDKIRLVYPIHPRTRKMIEEHGLEPAVKAMPNLILVDPLGYIDFVRLVKDSCFVLTDSGGIQEETTVLKVPCITMRENTERPVTITEGTNILAGRDRAKIFQAVGKILAGRVKRGRIPKFWDGRAAERIAQKLN